MVLLGAIHLYNAPGEYQEAHSIGLLFLANCIASWVAAAGIFRGSKGWGWGLGVLISAGTCAGYILSRTIGLPGMEIERWLNPTGIISLGVEGLFFILIAYLAKDRIRSSFQAASSRTTGPVAK